MGQRLRAALGFLEKLTLEPDRVDADDIAALRRAGLDDAAIEDAIHVCAIFNTLDRVADALDFDVPGADAFAESAGVLLERGYA